MEMASTPLVAQPDKYMPVTRLMTVSFLIVLGVVLATVRQIDAGLKDSAHHVNHTLQEASNSERDVHALTQQVVPAHTLELAARDFVHEFEMTLLDPARDTKRLIEVSESFLYAANTLPARATDQLSPQDRHHFTETIGILTDIVGEISDASSPSELLQLLNDSRDSVVELGAMIDTLRTNVERQGTRAIALAENSARDARLQVTRQQAQAKDLNIRVLYLLGALAVVFVATTSGIYWVLARRLALVRRYTRRVAAGDFDARLLLASRDAIGAVASDVERMGRALAQQVVESKQARERTDQQAWIDESMRLLFEATLGESRLDALSARILDVLGERLNVVAGRLYYVNDQAVEPMASYGIEAAPHAVYRLGEGLPGLVAKTGRTKLITDVAHSDLVVTSGLLHGTPNAIYLIPIMLDDEPKALLELGLLTQTSERDNTFIEQARNHLAMSIHAAEQKNKTDQALAKLQENARLLERRGRELEDAKNAAEQASRSKSEFLANMSHEIRTPLNGIIGNTELLLSSTMPDRQRGFTRVIQRSGDALLDIINDILDFSKIEAGKLELEAVPFDLRALIEDLGELFSERAHDKGLELVCIVPPTESFGLRGDPTRLRQVLTNLIGNAIKFTEKGEVVVAVQRTTTDAVLRFDVRDTGIGVAPEAQALIFDAFAQADGSTSRKFGGTGLGLAVSKQLVELMGGTIGFDSVPGGGTTFWFTAHLPPAQVESPTWLASPETLRGMRVLIVDDNATNRALLEHELSAWQMAHECAQDGAEALEKLRLAAGRSAPFDLAILDRHMPGMDGIALTQSIRAEEAVAGIPVIMLSSVHDDTSKQELNETGIAHYLLKPVRQRELHKCLLAIAGQRIEACEPISNVAAPASEHERFDAKILVVDDSAINRSLAQDMLENLGCRVEAVDNGRAALDALAVRAYDLVLMDCQMPEMDGFEATRALRRREETNASGARIPVAAVTANAMVGDRQRCLAAGMDDYLSKPFKQQDLSALLKRRLAPTPSVSAVEHRQARDDTQTGAGDVAGVLERASLTDMRGLPRDADPAPLDS